MTKLFTILLSVVLLAGCDQTTLVNSTSYPASCASNDSVCERNLNAQTLAYIGHKEAATELMCTDPKIRKVLDECGNPLQYPSR